MLEGDPISLRVSLAEQCQLHCCYCRPSQADRPLDGPGLAPAEWLRRIRALARAIPIATLRCTGGEPLLYPGLEEVIRGCADLGLPDLALTSNGLRLASRAERLRDCGLQRVNISLDSRDPEAFRRITGSSPTPVLEAVDASIEAGLQVKLNAVIMRGLNDRCILDLLAYAAEKKVPVRFLEMMPIGPAAATFKDRYISGQEMMDRISGSVALRALPYSRGATSRDFLARWPDGREAVCGFILPTSTPFCDGCRRLRLASNGSLLGCLAQPGRLDLTAALAAADAGDFEPLRNAVAAALAIKRRPQAFEAQQAMVRVGG